MDSNEIAKKQLRWTQILTAAVLALLCLALALSFTLWRAMDSARELTARVDALTADLDPQELKDSLEALQRTARQMEAMDWEKLGTNANEALEQAKTSLQEMSEAMDKMDFDAMNQAIKDLQTVIEPLARFAGRFS